MYTMSNNLFKLNTVGRNKVHQVETVAHCKIGIREGLWGRKVHKPSPIPQSSTASLMVWPSPILQPDYTIVQSQSYI